MKETNATNECLSSGCREPGNVRSLMGAIVGDVVGSRWEFGGCKTKDFPFLDSHCEATDDTFMTLAIGDALIEHLSGGGDLSELAIDKMKEWARGYPNAGYGTGFLCWALGDVKSPYNSWGNGAAMRVSICGWAAKSLEEAAAFSDAVTRVTHNHPEGMAGARIVAECVFLAKIGAALPAIRDYVNANYRKIEFSVDEIRPIYDFDISCQGTVPQALACFFESTSFEDAIRNAISLGGDSDTLGAICGAVAGAYWGIPTGIIAANRIFLDNRCKAMIEKLESCFANGNVCCTVRQGGLSRIMV